MQEVFGVLIVVGAALFFGVRFFLRRKEKDKEDMEDMRVSTEKLKDELGKSADTVIERMGIHVKHLEKLLAEADAKNAELTNRLRKSRQERLEMEELCDRAAQLLKREQQQREAQAVAPAPPPVYVQTDTVQAVPKYQDPLAYAAAGFAMPAREPVAPAPSPAPQPQTEPPQANAPEAQQPMPDTSTMERQDAIDFATVLQESIERDAQTANGEANEAAAGAPQEPAPEPAPAEAPAVQQIAEQEPQPEELPEAEYRILPEEQEGAPDAAGPAEEDTEEEKPPAEATVADRARALLLSGESIEEVSRETGMGIGALELLREMSRREQEEKS